jgi:hypothetical protein
LGRSARRNSDPALAIEVGNAHRAQDAITRLDLRTIRAEENLHARALHEGDQALVAPTVESHRFNATSTSVV